MRKNKFHKKYVKIEKMPSGRTFKAYYDDGENDVIFCGEYTISWTRAEIKEDVIKEMEARFH